MRMIKTDARLIKRLFNEYTKPKLPWLILAIIFMVIFSVANSSQLFIIKEVFHDILKNKGGSSTYILPLKIIGLFTLLGLSSYASNLTMSYVGFGIVNDMQKKLFRHIIHSDIKFHYSKNSGELISRISNDVGMIRAAVTDFIVGIFRQALSMAFTVGIMINMDWRLSIITFLILGLIVYPIMRAGKRLRKLARQSAEQTAVITSKMGETFSGIRTVKSYQTEESEIKRLNGLMDKNFINRIKSVRVSNINGPILSILSGFAIATVIWYVSASADKSKEANVIAFAAGMLMLLRPAKSMGNLSNTIQNALAAAERYFAILDTKPGIENKQNAQNLEVKTGEIKFENVSFKYDAPEGQGSYALNSLNLVVPGGKHVALVGHSGSGKSTIMNLLLRFFEPESGRILIDGQDITEVTTESLRSNLSLVTQDIFLFDASVSENIGYGRADATEEMIESAAKTAVADEFIKNLPQGYNTMVGEDGIRLSGGQKQRVSIARAILRDTDILLLDEATSALDSVSEREFQAALENLMAGKTTLIIAHRLSTVVNADIIYVMSEGRVVDSGTHKELLEKSEIYRKLFNFQ